MHVDFQFSISSTDANHCRTESERTRENHKWYDTWVNDGRKVTSYYSNSRTSKRERATLHVFFSLSHSRMELNWVPKKRSKLVNTQCIIACMDFLFKSRISFQFNSFQFYSWRRFCILESVLKTDDYSFFFSSPLMRSLSGMHTFEMKWNVSHWNEMLNWTCRSLLIATMSGETIIIIIILLFFITSLHTISFGMDFVWSGFQIELFRQIRQVSKCDRTSEKNCFRFIIQMNLRWNNSVSIITSGIKHLVVKAFLRTVGLFE